MSASETFESIFFFQTFMIEYSKKFKETFSSNNIKLPIEPSIHSVGRLEKMKLFLFNICFQRRSHHTYSEALWM